MCSQYVQVYKCMCVCVCLYGCIRGIWVRTTYYGLRLPSTRARTRELGGTTWHIGIEAYRCNPRWGSRTLGPPLAPVCGTRPLLPNNRHHRSITLSLTVLSKTREKQVYLHVRTY